MVTFNIPLVDPITVYDDDVFAFGNDGIFRHYNRYGHEVYRLDIRRQDIRSFFLKFGYLFLLGKDGSLAAYDAAYGYPVWRFTTLPVTQLEVSFPYLFFTGKNNTLGSLDFFSGQLLWQRAKFNADIVTFSPLFNQLLVFSDGYVYGINPATGDVADRFPVPLPSFDILAVSADHLLLSSGGKLFRYNRQLKVLEPTPGFEGKGTEDIFEGSYAASESGQLVSHDLLKGTINWKKKLSAPVSHIVRNPNELFVVTDDQRGYLLEARSGETQASLLLEEVPVSGADIRTFIYSPAGLSLIGYDKIVIVDLGARHRFSTDEEWENDETEDEASSNKELP